MLRSCPLNRWWKTHHCQLSSLWAQVRLAPTSSTPPTDGLDGPPISSPRAILSTCLTSRRVGAHSGIQDRVAWRVSAHLIWCQISSPTSRTTATNGRRPSCTPSGPAPGVWAIRHLMHSTGARCNTRRTASSASNKTPWHIRLLWILWVTVISSVTRKRVPTVFLLLFFF